MLHTRWKCLAAYRFGQLLAIIILAYLSPCGSVAIAQKAKSVEKQATREVFIEHLLSQMTLEEKIGQMTQLCASSITLDGTKNLDLNAEKIGQLINRYHIGSFISGTGPAAKWSAFMTELQGAAKRSRLQIPLVFGIDHVHGSSYVTEGTIFPHNLNLANTFDTALIAKVGRVTAREMIPLGLHWNFAPVCDVARTPYWPRFYETFGESPLVVSQLVSAFVRASESIEIGGAKSAACAKHFIGYSNPSTGYDRTPSELATSSLLNIYTPPFKAAFAVGVHSVMLNSGELNGEPLHGSKRYIRQFLRRDLGYDGVIVTDIKDILKMVEMHGAFPNEEAATLAAIEAGIDVSMACNSTQFIDITLGLVKSGKVSTARIDSSVRRILKMKYDLDLFKNPFPQKVKPTTFYNKEAQALTLLAAQKSLVLLENKGDLPLIPEPKLRVLVAGFAGNSKRILNGPWSWEWLGALEQNQPEHTKTLFTAIKEVYANATLLDWDATQSAEERIEAFKKALPDADFVVLTTGEQPYSEFKGNLNDLRLDSTHQALLSAMAGKQGVLVLLEGRPRTFTLPYDSKTSVLFAGIPGPRGGEAIASVISGRFDPTGRLAFTYPATVGHTPTLDRKPSDLYKPKYPHAIEDVEIVDSSRKNEGYVRLQITQKQLKGQPVMVYAEGGFNELTLPTKELIWFGHPTSRVQTVDVDFRQRLFYYNNSGVTTRTHGRLRFSVDGKGVSVRLD